MLLLVNFVGAKLMAILRPSVNEGVSSDRTRPSAQQQSTRLSSCLRILVLASFVLHAHCETPEGTVAPPSLPASSFPSSRSNSMSSVAQTVDSSQRPPAYITKATYDNLEMLMESRRLKQSLRWLSTPTSGNTYTALSSLYLSTDGHNWWTKTNWMSGHPCTASW